MRKPNFIKVTTHPPKNPWPVVNRRKMEVLKRIGKKFGQQGNSLYLTGSASGKEEADRVNDLDLAVIVDNPSNLYQAERLARGNREIRGIRIPVTYLFLPFDWLISIENLISNPRLSPTFFTYIKTNHLWLGVENF